MYRAMLLGALVAAVAVTPPVTAAPHVEQFHAVFSGFNEVGGLNAFTGAILSPGQATLELRLNRADQTLSFVLRYSGLQNDVTQAHIHFGKSHMAGGVMVFFCSNVGPANVQACPLRYGMVTGTLSAADVIGPGAQNVTAGNFDALVDALESDTTYANIHTVKFAAGEIRGEIRRGFGFGSQDE